jgi:hypothetical protein
MKFANFVPITLEVLGEVGTEREVVFRTTFESGLKKKNVSVGQITSYNIEAATVGEVPKITSVMVKWENDQQFNYDPKSLLINTGDPWKTAVLTIKPTEKSSNPNTAFRRYKQNDRSVQRGIRIPE